MSGPLAPVVDTQSVQLGAQSPLIPEEPDIAVLSTSFVTPNVPGQRFGGFPISLLPSALGSQLVADSTAGELSTVETALGVSSRMSAT